MRCDYGNRSCGFRCHMEWKIGCSGYHYPEWKRLFYPEGIPQNKWFEYYCEHFNTLELNVTYYRFPRPEVLRKWYARSPAGFTFTVKAPRFITHFRKFRDAQRMLGDFGAVTKAGLSEKLGSVLFQFPANFQYTTERLMRILEMLDISVQNVLEFRHPSWWDPEVYAALREANVSFCGMSHPDLPDTVVCTSPVLYYRFHGVPHLYNSEYTTQRLEQIVREIVKHRQAREVFAYFNNTAEAHAVNNARQLQEICELVH